MGRRIFISYSRNDKVHLPPLRKGLERLHHRLWLDEQLEGGQQWWDEVLTQLRDCDVLLVGVSEAMLDSDACKAELRYAQALGKPVLPVVLDRVNTDLLPSSLAHLQLVDYTPANASAPFDLMAALDRLPEAPALPEPLPEPPAVPVSYLSGLGELVHEPSLTMDQQQLLVQKLRAGLYRPRDRDGVLELMRGLRERDDLYVSTSRALDEAFDEAARSQPTAVPRAEQPAPPPPPSPYAETQHAGPDEAAIAVWIAHQRRRQRRNRLLVGLTVAVLLAVGAGIAAALTRTTPEGGGSDGSGGGSGSDSATVLAVGDECVVGSWRSTEVSIPDGGGVTSGGAGLTLEITGDGEATYDFSSMDPLEGTSEGDEMRIEFTGQLTTKLVASGGRTSETVVSDTVSFQTYRNGTAEGSAQTGTEDFVEAKPYSCTSSSLKLGSTADSITFERQ